MKLEAHRVGEGAARQSDLFDRAFALFDPLRGQFRADCRRWRRFQSFGWQVFFALNGVSGIPMNR
jgi:hypothetical protein